MAQRADLARGSKIYILSLFVALIAGMLAVVAVGGTAEPRTPSRAIVVLVFFTTLIGSMIVLGSIRS
ncbi:hypothetical protein E6P09_07530 [Haloferax mediterranei ATCC 33500]|nr:hypothetical protein E6P09_07530 [Haloferax mediterranei ATCC 33500]